MQFSFSTSVVTAPLRLFFFFNDTATTEIYTLSLHDALPISGREEAGLVVGLFDRPVGAESVADDARSHHTHRRSEEHTSELQSRQYLVCRLLLEKKKKTHKTPSYFHA